MMIVNEKVQFIEKLRHRSSPIRKRLNVPGNRADNLGKLLLRYTKEADIDGRRLRIRLQERSPISWPFLFLRSGMPSDCYLPSKSSSPTHIVRMVQDWHRRELSQF